ncbi:hypothetical protein AALO_G00224080 [Alosa alosa]|uniref:Ig-like domain-containing protein n=1 Tax=Alosa alosa TaxID=278164 RepID=A0AAV6G2F5_9TELE|nr:uncharacterized protein LOC125310661 [Alosa alosa]KAG5267650.1 hypothetical protein AALO_G00224080 [Alosa alosa]
MSDIVSDVCVIVSFVSKPPLKMKLCLSVLYAALHITVGCTISDPKHDTITRSPGESVLLLCSCTDLHTKPDEIRWRGPNDNKKEFYKLTGNLKPKVKKRYRVRVQTFSDTSPGNASLLLSNLTEEDQGEYMCVIETNSRGGIRIITLIIKRARAGLFSIVLIIIILLVGVLGTAAVIYWRYRKRRNEPSDSRGEHSGQEQQQNEDVTYTTVVHGNTARAAPRDANTEEATEHASIRADGDVTYSTVDHGNRATPPPKEINTEENTEYSSIRLDRA